MLFLRFTIVPKKQRLVFTELHYCNYRGTTLLAKVTYFTNLRLLVGLSAQFCVMYVAPSGFRRRLPPKVENKR